MIRVIIAMRIASAATAAGQILICRGMQAVGSLETAAPPALVSYFAWTPKNPYVIGGTCPNAVFYFLRLTTLSWTGVTVALPLTGFEHVFAALMASPSRKRRYHPYAGWELCSSSAESPSSA